jgi:polyisoprenoid-binding protein YceI
MLGRMLSITFVVALAATSTAQVFTTKTAHVWFRSSAPLETIEAHHYGARSALNTETGAMEFSMLLTGFQFEKSLMQEHFNENYVESHKYPKATFKGSIVQPSNVNYQLPGKYPVTVTGKLTLHGVTRDVTANGYITVGNSGELSASSRFDLRLRDYDISIPKPVVDKVANDVTIQVEAKGYAPKS